MSLPSKVEYQLYKKQVLKVVIGLNNFSVSKVMKKVQAAEIGEATYIDIAANTSILSEIKRKSLLPVCVSSIDPSELSCCWKAGADILEIGNFDVFYKKGVELPISHIMDITGQLLNSVSNAPVCVTIPYYLPLSKQINIAKQLERMGVCMIQTEGSNYYHTSSLIQSFSCSCFSLSSTYVLSKNVKIPVISASRLNSLSASVAIACGAHGVAIGSFIKQDDTTNLSEFVNSIIRAIEKNKYLSMSSKNIILNQNISCTYLKLNYLKVL